MGPLTRRMSSLPSYCLFYQRVRPLASRCGGRILSISLFCGDACLGFPIVLHRLPALILRALGRIGIFIPLQPKVEPVDVALLRLQSFQGPLMNVSPFWEVDEVHGFMLHVERGVQLPFLKNRGWIEELREFRLPSDSGRRKLREY
jgi:hypothetical protein